MNLRSLELVVEIGEFRNWNSYRQVHLLLRYKHIRLFNPEMRSMRTNPIQLVDLICDSFLMVDECSKR
jgi:hypothetical protein